MSSYSHAHTQLLSHQAKMENEMENGLGEGEFDPNMMGKLNEDGCESRSGSDNFEDAAGDGYEQEAAAADNERGPKKRKKYHRHTTQQIQELEAFFKECPHPDDKQRLALSRRLCLETKQVKFWFQNRRTQMKTQIERHENVMLKQENEKLGLENAAIREQMRNPICNNCGVSAAAGDVSYEENHLRIENARLKDELIRICAIADKVFGRPIALLSNHIPPQGPNSGLELAVGRNGFGGLSSMNTALSMGVDLRDGARSASPIIPLTSQAMSLPHIEMQFEKSMLFDISIAAMDELAKKAQTNSPLWIRGMDGEKEILNHEEYMRTFTAIGMKPSNSVTEATRETSIVNVKSLALIETLMDADRWAAMFPCLITGAFTTDVITSGINGTRDGALQLMHAELRVLSPLVPARLVRFLRFCKQHADGLWVVVDMSIDTIQEASNAHTYFNYKRLPSGCVVQDLPNGCSKVTWVEHAEYDESEVHGIYRQLVRSGMGFGAQRWLATLQRQCECLAILMSPAVPVENPPELTPSGRNNMLNLAQRMVDNFCSGICGSSARKWEKLQAGNLGADMKVMTRRSLGDPGEPSGVVLSVATSVWMPVTMQRLFDFLRDKRVRSQWDSLSTGVPMQEMVHIAKGQYHGNGVSLLLASTMGTNESSMLILQETWIDASGSLIAYAPIDIPAMSSVMSGGDSACVALLPSGFAIVPDGGTPDYKGPNNCNGNLVEGIEGSNHGGDGSLLTVGFQILVNSLPSARLTLESVEAVNNLISCTIQKIKAACT